MNKILFALLFASVSFSGIQVASAGKTVREDKEDQKLLTPLSHRKSKKTQGAPEKKKVVIRIHPNHVSATDNVELQENENDQYVSKPFDPERIPATPTKKNSAARRYIIERSLLKGDMQIDKNGNTWHIKNGKSLLSQLTLSDTQ